MYRIELRPGEEAALRTIEELAIGIRNGVITPRARIWHNAGQKWLPIEFHPHYQAALKLLDGSASPTETQAAPAQPAIETAAPAAEEPAVPALPVARRRRSARRPIGLVAAGVVLVLGVHVVLSATPADTEPQVPTKPAAVTAPRPTLPPAKPAELGASIPKPSPAPAARVAPAPAPAPAPGPKPVPGGAVVRGAAQVAPPSQPEPVAPAPVPPPIAPAPAPADVGTPSVSPDLPAIAPPPASDSSRAAIDAIRKAVVDRASDAPAAPHP